MSKSLRDAVRDATAKKRKSGNIKSSKNRIKTSKYFQVNIHFTIEAPYHLQELVTCDIIEEAEEIALDRFNARKDHNNLVMGDRRKNTQCVITNVVAEKTIVKNKPQLSYSQRNTLFALAKGYKLYPEKYGKGYYLKNDVTQAINWKKRKNFYVTQSTVKSLWKKGLVITPELLLLNKKEVKVQKALGTLTKNDVLVINLPVVTALKLDIVPKTKK